jgi:hypothetical protein
MVREGPAQPAPYPAEKMREDRSRSRRTHLGAIVMCGLAIVVTVALALAYWG